MDKEETKIPTISIKINSINDIRDIMDIIQFDYLRDMPVRCRKCKSMVHSKLTTTKIWGGEISTEDMSDGIPFSDINKKDKLYIETYKCETCGEELKIVKKLDKSTSLSKESLSK